MRMNAYKGGRIRMLVWASGALLIAPIELLLVIISIASTAYAQALPKAEPSLAEIVDWQTVHRECGRGKQFVASADEQCIRRVVARMPVFDPAKREMFGKHYDPQKYLECRLKEPSWGSACGTFLTLQRRPAPEYWPYPEAKRPSPPPPELDKYYRSGIGPKEYYDALCKDVAGEFILRTVESVDGIYQIRPRPEVSDDALDDRYVLEDPYGYTIGDLHISFAGSFLGKGRYLFAETPNIQVYPGLPRTGSFLRITILDSENGKKAFSGTENIRSQYGYTWREFTGIRERELGISGSDLIVVDLKSGELLGYKRGIARSVATVRGPGGANWASTQNCPMVTVSTRIASKTHDFAYWFVQKVLKPTSKKGD